MSEAKKDNTGQIYILAVDDEVSIRSVIQQGIRRIGYSCSVVCNGEDALNFLENQKVDVVITDIIMPGMNGIELTKIIKEKYECDVIMMTGHVEDYTYDMIVGTGASDFIHKPMTFKELTLRLKRVLREREAFAERKRAEEELKQSLEKLQRTINGIVQAMAMAVEVRDPYTAGHQKRVAYLAGAIAKKMNLPSDQIDSVRTAGFIHDLGKIRVPAEILSKPGKLSELEFGLIKTHPQVGYDILKTIEFPWPIAEMVFQHHERIDGCGYPRGLIGDEILLEARILAVADVVEAIATHRPYRAALGIEVALEEILKNSSTMFDPEVADVCLKLFSDKEFSFE